MIINLKNYIILHTSKFEDKKELNKILHSRGWKWQGTGYSLADKPLYAEDCNPKVSKEYYALCLQEKRLANVIIYDIENLKKFLVIEIKSKPDKKGWFF